MELDFRKPLIALLVLIGILYYVRTRYTLQDALALSRERPSPTVSPMVDYYAGMAYYMRDRYEPAVRAFTQLLTDYPTCQYAPRGLLRLGDSYERLSNWDGAREAYEKYMERFPEGRNIQLVRGKYEYIKFKGK